MLDCLIKVSVVKPTKFTFTRRSKKVSRCQLHFAETIQGDVTSPLSQVAREVAKYVHKLESFPETNAISQQESVVELGLRKEMCAANLRPKLTHTAGDAIGVIVQLCVALKDDDFFCGCAREPFQIQFLSADDNGEQI